ncbi:class I tRNA ligase family protein, partial [Streptomyces mirabilis]
EDGRKMSKHLGNILQPIPLMDQHGADAVSNPHGHFPLDPN